eukprot:1372820-Rhodomonas_salina.1
MFHLWNSPDASSCCSRRPSDMPGARDRISVACSVWSSAFAVRCLVHAQTSPPCQSTGQIRELARAPFLATGLTQRMAITARDQRVPCHPSSVVSSALSLRACHAMPATHLQYATVRADPPTVVVPVRTHYVTTEVTPPPTRYATSLRACCIPAYALATPCPELLFMFHATTIRACYANGQGSLNVSCDAMPGSDPSCNAPRLSQPPMYPPAPPACLLYTSPSPRDRG